MKKNLHPIDQFLRIIVGVLALLFMMSKNQDFLLELLVGVAGFYCIATASIGVCPLYLFLNVKTDTKSRNNRFY